MDCDARLGDNMSCPGGAHIKKGAVRKGAAC